MCQLVHSSTKNELAGAVVPRRARRPPGLHDDETMPSTWFLPLGTGRRGRNDGLKRDARSLAAARAVCGGLGPWLVG